MKKGNNPSLTIQKIFDKLILHKEVILWKRDEKIKGLTKRYMYDADFIESFLTDKLQEVERESYQIGYDDGHKNGWEERGKLSTSNRPVIDQKQLNGKYPGELEEEAKND